MGRVSDERTLDRYSVRKTTIGVKHGDKNNTATEGIGAEIYY